jgi:hypothetical protein
MVAKNVKFTILEQGILNVLVLWCSSPDFKLNKIV